MKEHKKLYKSGKLWMTATVMALAAGTTMATTTAHADTTPATNTSSEAQTTDQQKAALQKDIQDKQQQVSDKNDQVTNLQNELDSYKGQLNDENTNYQKEQDQIKKDATDKVTSVNSQINNTQSQLSDAQKAVSDTQSEIDNTNSQISDLQSQQGTTHTNDANVISVPNGNLDKSASLLENVARNNLWDNYYNNQQADNIWNKNIIPSNIYISPNNDKAQEHGTPSPVQITDVYLPYQNDIDQVNTNTGMTESQMRELSILLLNEINHARAQRGLAPFVMTEAQFQRAMARARQNSAANLDHNSSDMTNALGSDWHSENLALVDADDGSNMLVLLYNANNSVSSMLNGDADSAWGHRNNFLDDGDYNAAFGFRLLNNGYYAMTFDTTYANDADKSNDLVANTINNYAAMGPVKAASTTTIDNSDKINQLKNHLIDLNNKLSGQQITVNKLQDKLNDLKNEKSQISSDEKTKLSDSTTKHNTKVADLNNEISNHKDNLTQLKDEIEGLQTAIAQDQTALNNLNQGSQTPVEAKKDNEKYTNLDPSLVVAVHVTAGDTDIPAPTLADDAFIKDTSANTASAAMFMVLAQTNGVYPEGTKVEWADPAKVQRDAQTAGTYDEDVILDFPDGTKSQPFNVPGTLVVAAKQTPSTDPTNPSTGDDSHTTNPTESNHTLTVHYIEVTGTHADGTPITKVVGTQTFTGKQGDTINTDQIHVPDCYKLAMAGVTYTIGDKDDSLEQPVVSVNTPSIDHNHDNQPATTPTDNKSNDHKAADQLPTGAKIENNQVVDGNGHVLAGWKVVNGQAVKSTDQPATMTREAYKDQQTKNNAKSLPQTGNNDNLAVMGLGAATLLGMFGLAGLNKKRG